MKRQATVWENSDKWLLSRDLKKSYNSYKSVRSQTTKNNREKKKI